MELQARKLMNEFSAKLGANLVDTISNAIQLTDTDIAHQRSRIQILVDKLKHSRSIKAQRLLQLSEFLVKRSIWIVGGDGWAYDIGFGGVDHVLASGRDVNILVLDNEFYSNTGGQMSKATPYGATAKFAAGGKKGHKKDLGKLAIQYDNVYVASVAMGASREQCLKAFVEAERHSGPSLIIAYCHSPAHGIDMRRPQQYHRAAVDSGQWLLYRYDPKLLENGQNPLQLDSTRPSLSLREYYSLEARFGNLVHNEDKLGDSTIRDLQDGVTRRYNGYLLGAT
jgi:pyruvate-ferredoxin/flavodoxin oxidoreductase